MQSSRLASFSYTSTQLVSMMETYCIVNGIGPLVSVLSYSGSQLLTNMNTTVRIWIWTKFLDL